MDECITDCIESNVLQGVRHLAHRSLVLAVVIVVGTTVHAVLIAGASETISKATLCALVIATKIKVVADLRV